MNIGPRPRLSIINYFNKTMQCSVLEPVTVSYNCLFVAEDIITHTFPVLHL